MARSLGRRDGLGGSCPHRGRTAPRPSERAGESPCERQARRTLPARRAPSADKEMRTSAKAGRRSMAAETVTAEQSNPRPNAVQGAQGMVRTVLKPCVICSSRVDHGTLTGRKSRDCLWQGTAAAWLMRRPDQHKGTIHHATANREPATPSPARSTTPANSWPKPDGSVYERLRQSIGLRPAGATRTRTSPGPACGFRAPKKMNLMRRWRPGS